MIHSKFLRRIWLIGLLATGLSMHADGQIWNPNNTVGTSTGVYDFPYNQVPAQLTTIYQPVIGSTGLTFQWEYSPYPITGFTPVNNAAGTPQITGTSTAQSLTFAAPLAQTTYFRLKSTASIPIFFGLVATISIYSNTAKITVVSVNWEDINYIREHDVNTTGISTWPAVDQLPIGQKLQTTTYLDGIGRTVEKISRETATPSQAGNLWGDMVQFSQFDAMGREPAKYLPYTTTTQSGKFKTAPLTEQP